jgi:hypothetical protein
MTAAEPTQTETNEAPAANGSPKEKKGKSEKDYAITPITVTHPETVDPASIRLFREPEWRLRLTIKDDRSYTLVKAVRAAPLSHPDLYISLLDLKNEEICMIEDPQTLPQEMRDILRQELDRRYLTAVIDRILSLRNDFGTSYWEVDTSRGRREFVVQSVAENAQWLGDSRLLLIDVDGNRFEIPDLDGLDKKSTGLINQVL